MSANIYMRTSAALVLFLSCRHICASNGDEQQADHEGRCNVAYSTLEIQSHG